MGWSTSEEQGRPTKVAQLNTSNELDDRELSNTKRHLSMASRQGPGHVHMRPGIVPRHVGRGPARADMRGHPPGIQKGRPKTAQKENEKKKKQKKRTKKKKKQQKKKQKTQKKTTTNKQKKKKKKTKKIKKTEDDDDDDDEEDKEEQNHEDEEDT